MPPVDRVEKSDLDHEVTSPWQSASLGDDTLASSANASWSAIFAGVAVSVALLLLFSLLAAALGLGIADPTSDDPFDNVGLAVGITALVALAFSLAVGAFVAGSLAVRAGLLHGLAVWAASTIALVAAMVFAVSGVFGVAGSLLGSVGSALGSGAGGLAGVAGTVVSEATDGVGDALQDVDTSGYGDDIRQILEDTGTPELQPEYLEDQLDGARNDATNAAKDLVTDPGDYEQILDGLTDSLQQRVDTIADAADEDAISQAVAKNTELSEAEAEEATANAVQAVQDARDQFSTSLDDARGAIDDAREKIPQLIDDARETLDDAADAASKAAIWAFVGLLVGLVIACFAGLFGSRLVVSRREAERSTLPVGTLTERDIEVVEVTEL